MTPQPSINTRKIPKQQRAQNTRNILLKATAQFLRRRNYAELSTNKIAELAGVSIGTLYQYYSSKESLIVALVRQQFEQDLAYVQSIMTASEALSFEEGVKTIVRVVLGMFSEQTQLRLVIYEEAKRLSMLESKESFQQKIRHLLLENFEKHSRGEYEQPSELSMYVVTTAIVGALVAAASEHPEYLTSPLFEAEIVKLILGYYRRVSPARFES